MLPQVGHFSTMTWALLAWIPVRVRDLPFWEVLENVVRKKPVPVSLDHPLDTTRFRSSSGTRAHRSGPNPHDLAPPAVSS